MSEEATPALPQATPAAGRVLRGFGYGAAANGLAIVAGFLTMGLLVGYIVLLGFGVVQLAWIVPMYLKYKRSGETETAKGILIAAGVTILLQGGCYAFVATSLRIR